MNSRASFFFMWILVYENQFFTGVDASPVPHSDRNSNDSNVLDNCSPFLWSCLAIFFLSFCSILVWCQPQAPFLQTDRVKAWMLNNAHKLDVFRNVLKHEEKIFRHENVDVTICNNKLALVDRLQRRKCDYRSNLPISDFFCTIKALLERLL